MAELPADPMDEFNDDIIRLQTDMFAEMLRLSTAAMLDDAVDSDGFERQTSLSEDMTEGRVHLFDSPDSAVSGGQFALRSMHSVCSAPLSLTPEQKKECKELASKLDMVAGEINKKYDSAQQKLQSASSYTDFESAITEALRSSDPTVNQVTLLYRLTRDAAVASWTSASNLVTWSTQFFQQRLAKQVVQDHKSLKSCVEEAASTRSHEANSLEESSIHAVDGCVKTEQS